jgi:hypothetical protein|eukprot:COSAG06_NODE_104_length_23856_cov_6.259629_16_plen_125_part_00
MLIDGFPAYLRDVNGASLTSAGLASAAPQVAVALLTTLGAVVADYLRGSRGPGRLSTRAVRRLMHTMGTGCNAVLLLLVGAGCVRACVLSRNLPPSGSLSFATEEKTPDFTKTISGQLPRHCGL